MSSYLDMLESLCDQHGLGKPDQTAAIEVYLRRGSLSREDVAVLDAASTEDQTRYLVGRFGMDAIRVARIAYDSGWGGR